MQAALTTPATRTRCARTSTRSPTFPRHKGGTGGCSWGLVVRGAAEAEDLEYHPRSRSVARNANLAPLKTTSARPDSRLSSSTAAAPSPRERRCLAGARTSSAVHSRRPRSTDFRLKSSIPARRRRRSPRPPSPRGRRPSTRRSASWESKITIATCGRAAMLRECLASGSDIQKNSLHSAGAYQTGETKGRGRPPRRRCRWS
jgi:hypothetical protein